MYGSNFSKEAYETHTVWKDSYEEKKSFSETWYQKDAV